MQTATQISFDVTPFENQIILKLAARARAAETKHGGKARPSMDWVMDFTACHANGNPLRLEALLEANDFNFMHDAFGICRHLDRSTGELTGFFSPRFSAPVSEAA